MIDRIGLIFLPETQVYKNRKSLVLDVGPIRCDGKLIPNDEIKPGDYVAVIGFDGNQLDPVDDPNLLMVENSVLLGVLNGDSQFDA